jgi:phosphoglycolate phosphatase-like HAD superfamily hydrolase
VLTPKLVVFDLDGCLLNSIPGALKAHVESLALQGVRVDEREVLECLGSDANKTLKCLAERRADVAKLWNDGDARARLLDDNRDALSAYPEDVFPVARELVERCFEDRVPIGVFTSRKLVRAKRSLREQGLLASFPENMIVAADSAGVAAKPSGDGLRRLMQHAGVTEPARVLYLGDRENDLLAALDAGVGFAASAWSDTLYFAPTAFPLPVRTVLDCWTLGLVSTTSHWVPALQTLLGDKRLSVFVGAGFSLSAGFEDWAGLVAKLLGPSAEARSAESLPDVIQRYIDENRNLARQKIFEELRKALTPQSPPGRQHRLLAGLGVQRIWTTNFDSLIEDAIRQPGAQLVSEDKALTVPSERIQVLKLNGSVISDFAELVFSRASFEEQIETRREMVREFQSELLSKSILFLGTSFADPLMGSLLAELRNTSNRRPALPVHYTVRPRGSSELVDRIRSYGIDTIEVPTWASVEALLAELKWRSRPHRIVISGAWPEGQALSAEQQEFLRALGWGLVHAGFRIHFGSGPRVSEPLVDGAFAACTPRGPNYHRDAIVRFSRELAPDEIADRTTGRLIPKGLARLERLILPKGSTIFVAKPSDPQQDIYNPMRVEMFHRADVCLALAGEERSQGMAYEKGLAQQQKIPYLPIPFLPGYARSEYEDRKNAEFVAYDDARVGELLRHLADVQAPHTAARLAVAAAVTACLS